MTPISSTDVPRVGTLATVRNRRGIISAVEPYDSATEGRLYLVTVEYTDTEMPAKDQLIWKREPNLYFFTTTPSDRCRLFALRFPGIRSSLSHPPSPLVGVDLAWAAAYGSAWRYLPVGLLPRVHGAVGELVAPGGKGETMTTRSLLLLIILAGSPAIQIEDLGNLSANPYDLDSIAIPFAKGSPFGSKGLNNHFSPYARPFSNQSWTNPFATDAPRLYDQKGNYRGKLSTNPFVPDSTSNPFGRYGSLFSPDSLNSPFGLGRPYRPDSLLNPSGKGRQIEGSR